MKVKLFFKWAWYNLIKRYWTHVVTNPNVLREYNITPTHHLYPFLTKRPGWLTWDDLTGMEKEMNEWRSMNNASHEKNRNPTN